MITVNGIEYRNHQFRPLYVNGKQVNTVWVNDRIVYPEVRDGDMIKVRGHIDIRTDHTHIPPIYKRNRWYSRPDGYSVSSFYGEDYDNPFSVSFRMRASFVCVIRGTNGWGDGVSNRMIGPLTVKTMTGNFAYAQDEREDLDPEMHSTWTSLNAWYLVFGSSHYGGYQTITIQWSPWVFPSDYALRDCDMLLRYEMDPIPLCRTNVTSWFSERTRVTCYKTLEDSITWPCARNNEVIHLTGKMTGPLMRADDNAAYIYPAGESSGDRKFRVTMAGAREHLLGPDDDLTGYHVLDCISGVNLGLCDVIPYKYWEVDYNSPKDAQGRPILTEPTDRVINYDEARIQGVWEGFSALPFIPITDIDFIGVEADAPEWAKNVYETDLYDFGGDDNG